MGIRKKVKETLGIWFGKRNIPLVNRKDVATISPAPFSFEHKIQEMMPALIKYLPELRKVIRGEASADSDGTIIGRMFDFYKNWDESVGNPVVYDDELPLELSNGQGKKDERIVAKPFSVLLELDRIPAPITLQNLEDKINLFQKKSKLIHQRFSKDQCDGFVQRLKNRQHYDKVKDFYECFPNTTDEKIDLLLSKYKLDIGDADLFIPTLPKQAVDIMADYVAKTKSFTDESPIFYIIAEKGDFEAKRGKLDPILLVQSPFGFYWQILGAWDKEILLLSEL